MKTIKIHISEGSKSSSVISYLESQIPESTKTTTEFAVVFPQVVSCIEDFIDKARKLAKSGTTIHIKKEFILPGVKLLVSLDYPKKVSFFEKVSGMLKRD